MKDSNQRIEERLDSIESNHLPHIKEDISSLKTDVSWIKEIIKKLDDRTWYVLAAIITGFVITILIRVFFR